MDLHWVRDTSVPAREVYDLYSGDTRCQGYWVDDTDFRYSVSRDIAGKVLRARSSDGARVLCMTAYVLSLNE
jgi:hypothetical protein